MAINRRSDIVGGAKRFLSTLPRALEGQRHFALDENCRSNQGSLVIHSDQDTRSDPYISSVATAIMIATSNSSLVEEDKIGSHLCSAEQHAQARPARRALRPREHDPRFELKRSVADIQRVVHAASGESVY